jgi:hypothetical protein
VGKIMAIEIFRQTGIIGSEITALFADGGRLERSGRIWVYENNGKYYSANDPEIAVSGAEGLFRGRQIWHSNDRNKKKGGE